jgi:hypothetical protein
MAQSPRVLSPEAGNKPLDSIRTADNLLVLLNELLLIFAAHTTFAELRIHGEGVAPLVASTLVAAVGP